MPYLIKLIKKTFRMAHPAERRVVMGNVASLTSLQAITYVLPVIIMPYLFRIIGPEKFGLIAFAQAFVQYFAIITDYGFGISATKEISLCREERRKVSCVFSSVITVKILLAVLSLLALGLLRLALLALGLLLLGVWGAARYEKGGAGSSSAVRPLFLLVWLLAVVLGLMVGSLLFKPMYQGVRHIMAGSPAFLLLLAFGGLTLVAVRGVIWYGLATTPMLARAVAEAPMFRPEREQRGIVAMNRVLVGLLGLAGVVTLPWLRGYLPHPAIDPTHPYLGADTPVAAVAALRDLAAEAEVRPFHTEAYGSYLIYAAPEIPVFVDTRIELYPPEQWDDYLAASSARYDWFERLQRYGVNLLLLDRERQPDLLEAAQADARWQQIYEDEQAVILALR